jgi:hypothetical protein
MYPIIWIKPFRINFDNIGYHSFVEIPIVYIQDPFLQSLHFDRMGSAALFSNHGSKIICRIFNTVSCRC